MNLNRPPVPPVIPRVPALDKSQLALKLDALFKRRTILTLRRSLPMGGANQLLVPGSRRSEGRRFPTRKRDHPLYHHAFRSRGYALDFSSFSYVETVSRYLVFFLQKKCRLRFDESDDERTMSLLEAVTTPLCTFME